MFKTRYRLLDSPLYIDLPKLKVKLEKLARKEWTVKKVQSNYLKLSYTPPQALQYQIDYLPHTGLLTSSEDSIMSHYK